MQGEKDELFEAETLRDSLREEAYALRKEVKRLGRHLSEVEGELEGVKRRLLESKSKLKAKEQQRDAAGNKEESGRLEGKMEDKRKVLEEVQEEWRKSQEEVAAAELSLKDLETQRAAAQAEMVGLSEQTMLLRQRKEDLDAAHKTLQVKISRNGKDLRVLDEETALLLEDIKEC